MEKRFNLVIETIEYTDFTLWKVVLRFPNTEPLIKELETLDDALDFIRSTLSEKLGIQQ